MTIYNKITRIWKGKLQPFKVPKCALQECMNEILFIAHDNDKHNRNTGITTGLIAK